MNKFITVLDDIWGVISRALFWVFFCLVIPFALLLEEVHPGCTFWKIGDSVNVVATVPHGSICLTDENPQWEPGPKAIGESTMKHGASFAAALVAAILKAKE